MLLFSNYCVSEQLFKHSNKCGIEFTLKRKKNTFMLLRIRDLNNKYQFTRNKERTNLIAEHIDIVTCANTIPFFAKSEFGTNDVLKQNINFKKILLTISMVLSLSSNSFII